MGSTAPSSPGGASNQSPSSSVAPRRGRPTRQVPRDLSASAGDGPGGPSLPGPSTARPPASGQPVPRSTAARAPRARAASARRWRARPPPRSRAGGSARAARKRSSVRNPQLPSTYCRGSPRAGPASGRRTPSRAGDGPVELRGAARRPGDRRTPARRCAASLDPASASARTSRTGRAQLRLTLVSVSSWRRRSSATRASTTSSSSPASARSSL